MTGPVIPGHASAQAQAAAASRARARRPIALVSAVLYAAVLVSAIAPFRDVFLPGAARDRLLGACVLTVVAVLGFGAFQRAVRVPWWLQPPLCALPVVAVLHELITRPYPSTEVGAPVSGTGLRLAANGRTWVQLGLDAVRSALDGAQTSKRPTAAALGFALLLVAVVGSFSIIGQLLIVDLESPLAALVAPAILLVSATVLGPGRGAGGAVNRWAVVFVVAAAVFAWADGDRRARASLPWLRGTRPAIAARVAAALLAAVLVGALAAGTLHAVGDRFENRSKPRGAVARTRTVASPLVSLRARLLDLTDAPMFTVEARTKDGQVVGAYWRQSVLDRFDGVSWSKLPASFEAFDNGDTMDADPTVDTTGLVVRQKVTIEELNDAWLPAVPRVDRLLEGPSGHSVLAQTSTGDVLLDEDVAPGTTYELESTVPPDASAATSDPIPDEVLASDLDLSAGVAPSVRRLADDIIERAGVGTSGDAARAAALQDFFTTKFKYSTDVVWHGSDPLVTFLRERTGYCEQFASAFAVLARSLGIPARVAVGFTTGELQADGLFHVTGRQAHAWPEVFLVGRGWVAYEPTPGEGPSGRPTTTTSSTVVETTTPPAPSTEAAPAPPPPADDGLAPLLAKVAAVLGALLLLGATVVASLRLRAARRRAIAVGPHRGGRARLEAAWFELLTTLAATPAFAGASLFEPTLTPTDVVDMGAGLGTTRLALLRRIADALDQVRFAPEASTSGDTVASAVEAATTLDASLRSELTRAERLRRWLGIAVTPIAPDA